MNDFIDEDFDGTRAPFTAGFELTYKCNLNCAHCYANSGRRYKDMATDEFRNILIDEYNSTVRAFYRKFDLRKGSFDEGLDRNSRKR